MNEEVSVVDLFAVFLRRRRMILLTPILAGIVAFLTIYVAPETGLFSSDSAASYRAGITIELMPVPDEVLSILEWDILSAVTEMLQDTAIISRAYAKAAPVDLESLGKEEFNSIVELDIIGTRLSHSYSRATGILTLQYLSADPNRATLFLQELTKTMYTALSERLHRRTALAIEFNTRALDTAEVEMRNALDRAFVQAVQNNGDMALNSIEQARLTLDSTTAAIRIFSQSASKIGFLQEFMANEAYPFVQLSDPVVVSHRSPEASRLRRVVVVTLSAFFGAVFMAFVFEYIRKVEKDPQELAKLRSAWKRD